MGKPAGNESEIYDILAAAAELLPVGEELAAFRQLLTAGEFQPAYVELLEIARKHPLPLLFWSKVSRASELLGVP